MVLCAGLLGVIALFPIPPLSTAQEKQDKSLYSPIIAINVEKGLILVSGDGKVFPVEAPEAAKPHLDKLPVSGMLDLVVELRPDAPPLIKRWKLMAGESTCKIFDGKVCK